MASRKHDSESSEKARLSFILNPDSGTSGKAPEKARISFLLNPDDDDAVRTQPPTSSRALSPAQPRISSRSAKGVIKKRQKNSLCETCGHSFYSNSQLNKHVRTVHLLQKPFGCSMCDKKFGEKSNATQQGVHERQRNAACNQCNRVFAFRDGLVRHVRLVHENVRNYHCRHPGCGQTFKQSHNLKRHGKVHSRRGDGLGKFSSS